MRAIIRVILSDTTDEEAIALKKDIKKLVEKKEKVEVEITMM